MDRQQIGVKLAMDGLDLPFQINSFEDRLILQKAVYLAQAANVNLGYYYHWYLYGPYCPSLAQDEYTIAGELAQGIDESKTWELDEQFADRLRKLRNLIPKGKRAKISRELELLASVHFLVSREQVSGNDAGAITATLKRFRKDFSEEEVQSSLRKLIDHGLLSS